MKDRFLPLIFSSLYILASAPSQAATNISQDKQEQERQAKLDELYSACMQQKKKDKLCDSVITAKQIGNDSVEFIKEYMQLTPAAYAMLTLANMLATGRLRFKTKSFLSKKAEHIYDYQSRDNQITVIYEQRF